MSQITKRVNMKMMIKMMIKALKLAGLIFLASSCQPQGNGILSSNTPLSEYVDHATKSAPFAYDVSIDTISYNSCISETVKNSNIHGLKMGASEGPTDAVANAVWAGLKLRTDFLQQVGKNFKPNYGSTTIQPQQIQNLLALSDYNKDAYIQFAVRRKAGFDAVPDLIAPGSNGTKTVAHPRRDMTVFLQTLYSGVLGASLTKGVVYNGSGSVLSEGPRLTNISDVSEAVPLEATFRLNATDDESLPKTPPPPSMVNVTENYTTAENYAQFVRDRFTSGEYILAATFGGYQEVPEGIIASADTTNHINRLKRPLMANGVSQDTTKAFGRSYQLTFESPNPAISSWMKTKLTRVRETNLDTGSEVTDFSWSCENFIIMRADHWDNNVLENKMWVKGDSSLPDSMVEPTCSPLMATDLTGTNGTVRQAQIKRIRRHYSESQWNIGLYVPAAPRSGYTLPTRSALPLCLSPKSGECYFPTTGILTPVAPPAPNPYDIGIQYDTSKECYNVVTGAGQDTKRVLGRCGQFASICTRRR